ncbi:MAG: SoxR reducing system RseC family protein [Methylococcaceae bacterium]|jgi:positive regulator of sigma E activity
MIEQEVVVTRAEPGRVWIVPLGSGCGVCKQNCLTLLPVDTKFGRFERECEIPTSLILEKEDHVIAGISKNALLVASLTIYGFPLIAFLASSVVGEVIAQWFDVSDSDGFTALVGILGLVLALVLLRLKHVRISRDSRIILLRPVHRD